MTAVLALPKWRSHRPLSLRLPRAAHVQAQNLGVVTQIKQSAGKSRRLPREAEHLFAADFLVGLGRGAGDHQLALHGRDEKLAVGGDEIAFAEASFLPRALAGLGLDAGEVRDGA